MTSDAREVRGGQLVLAGLTKRYTNQLAVEALDLSVAAGEFLTLLGPSGSGKTTTLMMIAGFTQPSAGDILLNGRSIASLAPEKRNIGVVFQNYALFPHMSGDCGARLSAHLQRKRHVVGHGVMNDHTNADGGHPRLSGEAGAPSSGRTVNHRVLDHAPRLRRLPASRPAQPGQEPRLDVCHY